MRQGITWGCAALGLVLRVLMLASELSDISGRSDARTRLTCMHHAHAHSNMHCKIIPEFVLCSSMMIKSCIV